MNGPVHRIGPIGRLIAATAEMYGVDLAAGGMETVAGILAIATGR